jgi:uncharacterized protein YdhG (YjbR/CyaY superfamily)
MIMDKTQNIKFKTVDEYFSSVPNKVRNILVDLRLAIKQVVPGAEELISYNMPAFKFYQILVYYAAHKEHIGFYPGNANVIVIFKDELKDFETSNGTIKFPMDKRLPIKLIKTIVKFRANENLERSKRKTKIKK